MKLKFLVVGFFLPLFYLPLTAQIGLNLALPDYYSGKMLLLGRLSPGQTVTGFDVFKYQVTTNTDVNGEPDWNDVEWLNAADVLLTTPGNEITLGDAAEYHFLIKPSEQLTIGVEYFYRIRLNDNSPTSSKSNIFNLFWPLCNTEQCNEVDQYKGILTGFNQARGYGSGVGSNPAGLPDGIHKGLDIGGDILTPNEPVYVPFGGVIHKQVPTQKGDDLYFVVFYDLQPKLFTISHLQEVPAEFQNLNPLHPKPVKPGSFMGEIYTSTWNTENSHIHLQYDIKSGEDIFARDPLSLFNLLRACLGI